MADPVFTLMAVHAHPDDEALGTGGVLARYADEGVRTVLVTCTNGELGDAPGGVKPGEPGHDEAVVVPLRLQELEASSKVLGISHLELLGYHDSGMEGWPQNDAPGSFWHTPVAEAGHRLAELMEKYRPQVVVTYDENGFYGHPDHIQANRITLAAIAESKVPVKLYYTAVARSAIRGMGALLAEAGIDQPPEIEEDRPDFGTPDELITTTVDCLSVVDRKFASLAAHASQSDNIFFLQLGEELFATMMGTESFVRAQDSTGAPTPEDDLFAGLR
jgi:LmbE family N-acetylglucosaminyl deacetylase